ncbi:MAG: tyrosine-type recombinase/integrase, partial [Halanaerobiales bacterium]
AVEKGYSDLTIREYSGDLNIFYDFLTENADQEIPDITEISKYQVSEFLSDVILEHNNSPVTRNRKLYSLRAFFKFLKKFEYIEENPTEGIEASRTEKRAEPIYLKLDDARYYIRSIKSYNGINVKRDLAIVKLFLYAGLRISELVNLNRTDINFADQSIKFFGKGNKERYVPLHADVVQAVRNYLPERNQIKPSGEDARQALFLSRQGNRINVRTIQMFVKKYARRAGLRNADKITPHKLRHTFASLLYQKTKDLKVLQDLLGHTDISTTQIYTHTDTEQRKEAIDDLPEF